MTGDLILHIIRISRKRMIECGVDRLSRGITNEGVMKEISIMSFLSMHRSAMDRSDGLLP